MKILIDIPKDMDLRNYDIPYDILNIITNGTPLPEHHGRLIDADAVDTRYSDPEVVETLNDAPTIIEAEGSDSK